MTGKLPSGVYFELLKLAREYHISTHQLLLELLREGLKQRAKWKCSHDQKDRKFSRKKKQWYCSNCWTFFDMKTTGKAYVQIEREPSWELNKPLTNDEWAKQIKPDNSGLE